MNKMERDTIIYETEIIRRKNEVMFDYLVQLGRDYTTQNTGVKND